MNQEIDDIKQRLLTLEVALELMQDKEQSYLKLMAAAVRVAHRRDPQFLQEWLSDAQSSAAFGQGAFDKKPPQTWPILLGYFQALSDALTKSAPPR